MESTNISIDVIAETEEIPYDILLLSDDTKEAIDKNLDMGELYMGKQDGKIIAAFILKTFDKNTIEIKNIAVSESLQGKGYGTNLLNYIKDNAKKRGFKTLIVGTCDQCNKEIEFYTKSNFIVSNIRKNFFLDNYDNPIYENGLQIIDMILLKMDL